MCRIARIDASNYTKVWLKILGIYLSIHKLIPRAEEEDPVAFCTTERSCTSWGLYLIPFVSWWRAWGNRGSNEREKQKIQKDYFELDPRTNGIQEIHYRQDLSQSLTGESRGLWVLPVARHQPPPCYMWDLIFLVQSPRLSWAGTGSHLPFPCRARGWNTTHCTWQGQCHGQLGRLHGTSGVCSSPWPGVTKGWRNGDAIQILAFKKGGGDRKICRQQMWKEKESSGTRKMVQLVQVQKEGGWRQRGGIWATFESVFSKGCGFLFFLFIVSPCGWLAELRAMITAQGLLFAEEVSLEHMSAGRVLRGEKIWPWAKAKEWSKDSWGLYLIPTQV